jgi:PAS domain S-box-containing protein
LKTAVSFASGERSATVTAQKYAEQNLRDSEESYRIVAETASDAIIKIDENSRILFVNKAVERIFGYRVEEMIGQPLMMIMPEDMREKHLKGSTRYMKTGKRHLSWAGIEVPARHADGHLFPLEISFGEYNQRGRRYFIGIARDISERRAAEVKLRQSEANFRQLAEAVPQIVWVTEADGSLSYVNEQWREFSGLDARRNRKPAIDEGNFPS